MVGMTLDGLTTGVAFSLRRWFVEVEGLSPVRSVPPIVLLNIVVLCRGRCST
jgi:hypothetical protein